MYQEKLIAFDKENKHTSYIAGKDTLMCINKLEYPLLIALKWSVILLCAGNLVALLTALKLQYFRC